MRETIWLGRKACGLVHKLKDHNAEMRWLAELLPLDTKVTVQLAEQRLSEWCAAHPQDARALAHLAKRDARRGVV